jgi:hypothetical protein
MIIAGSVEAESYFDPPGESMLLAGSPWPLFFSFRDKFPAVGFLFRKKIGLNFLPEEGKIILIGLKI